MIDPHIFLVFMAGALALNLAPGPDMTFVLAQSASRGRRAGIAASLGIGVGTLFHMTLAAFRQGVLTNVMNPKVAMFFIAFLPQFVTKGGGPAWLQILVLGIAFDVS